MRAPDRIRTILLLIYEKRLSVTANGDWNYDWVNAC
jgi:hypothetical protein